MPLIECTAGKPVETNAGGQDYSFQRDKYGRYVAQVDKLEHAAILTSVEWYRQVPDVPEDVSETIAAKEPEGIKPKPKTPASAPKIPKPAPPVDPLKAGNAPETDQERADREAQERKNAAIEQQLAKEKEEERARLEAEKDRNKPESPEMQAQRKLLTRIPGIGKATAEKLAGIGVDEIAKIASWDDAMTAKVDEQLGLGGRPGRDKWVDNAKKLVAEDDAQAERERSAAPGSGE